MKRRSKAGIKPAKAQSQASKLKGRRTPKAVPSQILSPGGAEAELARLTRERDDALEQQTATSEVLKVISRSTFDLPKVLNTLVESAARLCAADNGVIFQRDGDLYRLAANFGFSREVERFVAEHPLRPDRGSVTGRAALGGKAIHIPDVLVDPEYRATDHQELGRYRTMLGVPLVREETTIGTFTLSRDEVNPFTDKQIELVTTFAAQAVIAIENARLLDELRQRTTDLTEALEQQTATSEVLQVISSSPGDVQPVFGTMLEKAVRICDATFGNIYRWRENALHLASTHNTPPGYAEHRRRSPMRFDEMPGAMQQMVRTHLPVQIDDVLTLDQSNAIVRAGAELGAIRIVLYVPMVKESELIGAFILSRQEVRPFTEKEIELVKNFAAQAIIAIENARLLNELRQRTTDLSQRTTDLTEALEQQTATSDVLQVISSFPGDLQPVFDAMLEKAARICDANFGNIYRWDGDAFHLVGTHNTPPALAEARGRSPVRFSARTPVGRMLVTKATVHVADLAAEPVYAEERDPTIVAGVELGGIRTLLLVPMLKENEVIGVFSLYRQEVHPFTEKQIALVANFTAQAVIAVENARLLNELHERSAELAAQSQELAKLNQQLEQRVADQVGEIERMGRLRRFLPPQVADLIVASGTEKQLESHRREITALFCDLRGFTGFSESADPEDVMALLRDYHTAIGEIIIKYSGTLERYAGDGVMVVFNDPVPVENPALQAVLMALEMRDAIGTLTETWRRWGHEIGFGIGIAHGFATLGTIGFEGRFDYAAIGTVSNVASRLCDEAKPGQILISPRVLTKVENAIKVEPVGEFELKGIRRPLAAYNVLAAKATIPD
jgi:class 3 adenylate cyclase/putative methionine-R-sulfoxide reductase with GAF domain